MNFNPGCSEVKMEVLFHSVAEQYIVRSIVEGSGGPDNEEITEDGLRFVRYLLSISRSTRFGFLPNFKDMDTIYELARQFIRYCGGASAARAPVSERCCGPAASGRGLRRRARDVRRVLEHAGYECISFGGLCRWSGLGRVRRTHRNPRS